MMMMLKQMNFVQNGFGLVIGQKYFVDDCLQRIGKGVDVFYILMAEREGDEIGI